MLTIMAVVLIALGSSRRNEKNPVLMLAGIAIGVISIPLHFMIGPQSIGGAIAALAQNVGLGFVIGAAVLAARRQPAKQFLILGVLALFVGFVFKSPAFLTQHLHVPHGSTEYASILVELGPDDTIEEVGDILAQFDATAERAFPTVSLSDDEDLAQVYLVTGIKKDLVKKLLDLLRKQLDDVDHAELNEGVGLLPPAITYDRLEARGSTFTANDPLTNQQWAMEGAAIENAHQLLRDATPVRKAVVAILDTGVDAGHEDISGTFIADSPGGSDSHGHGTHCAGIAGAATNNGKGMASLNWEGRFVEVSSYKALGDAGFGSLESIAQAIIDATTDGADVISLSLGGVHTNPTPGRHQRC